MPLCAVCGGLDKFKCGRCGEVWYCSAECQRQHWKRHKASCRDAKSSAGTSASSAAGVHGGGGDSGTVATPQVAVPHSSPAGAAPIIVCFIACHAHTAGRSVGLSRCLLSLAGQATPPAAVFLSWDAPEPSLRESVASAVSAASAEGLQVVEFQQTKTFSQFEHIQAIASSQRLRDVVGGRSAWVIFSDDDDLSHPNRVMAFAQASASIDGDASAELIVCPVHSRLREGVSVPEGLTADTIEALRQKLDVEVVGFDSPGPPEIFNHCIRLGALQRFLGTTLPAVLAHKFGDVRFASSCQRLRQCSFVPGDRSQWMYFYSNPLRGTRHAVTEAGSLLHPEDNERASLSLVVDGRDGDAARAAHEQLEKALGGTALLTREQVTCTLASMRQNLELLLILRHSDIPLPWAEVQQLARGAAADGLQSLPSTIAEELETIMTGANEDPRSRVDRWAVTLAEELAKNACAKFGLSIS